MICDPEIIENYVVDCIENEKPPIGITKQDLNLGFCIGSKIKKS